MRILIIGATGFIGRELMKELALHGHEPVAVSRNIKKAREILGNRAEIVECDGLSPAVLAGHLAATDAIVNLAGENIASGRWTSQKKKLITESRINTGQVLTEAIRLSLVKPKVLIQGSAIGYYGTPVEIPAGEDQPAGTGFMADLTRAWEASVAPAGNMIPRIILIRTGLVLGKNGGLLEKMALPFKFYCGTVIGSGKQWMSWIHISDEVRAIRFLLENNNCSGPYNLTAPNPVSMRSFIKFIGKTLRKPAWLIVPGIFLRAALGEMAVETVLASQNIYPGKLLNEGFIFEFLHLPGALNDLLNEKISSSC
jgi:uncharacterized protein (TIGR01777 family)